MGTIAIPPHAEQHNAPEGGHWWPAVRIDVLFADGTFEVVVDCRPVITGDTLWFNTDNHGKLSLVGAVQIVFTPVVLLPPVPHSSVGALMFGGLEAA